MRNAFWRVMARLTVNSQNNRWNKILTIINLERKCCSFLRFCLTVEPQEGPIWLEMTGPAETENFIELEMGLTPSPDL